MTRIGGPVWLVLGLLLGTGVYAGFNLTSVDSTPGDRQPQSTGSLESVPELQLMRERIGRLEQQVRDLQRELDAVAEREIAPAGVPQSQLSGEENVATLPADIAAALDQALNDPEIEAVPTRATLEERFQSEVEDPSWSTRSRSDLESDLASIGGSRYFSDAPICRETLCRVEIAGENLDSSDLALSLGDLDSFSGTQFTVFPAEDSSRAVVFVSRKRE